MRFKRNKLKKHLKNKNKSFFSPYTVHITQGKDKFDEDISEDTTTQRNTKKKRH